MEKFTIGKTRAGTIVTSWTTTEALSAEDMFDAWSMMEAFCVKELRRQVGATFLKRFLSDRKSSGKLW